MRQYYYDTDWLNAVKAGRCPDCDESTSYNPHTKTTSCNCGFLLIGEPSILAYGRTDTCHTIKNDVSRNHCPECGEKMPHDTFYYDDKRDETSCRGKFEYDPVTDENVCIEKGCGLVLDGPPAYVGGDLKIKYPFGNNYFIHVTTDTGKHGYYGTVTKYKPQNTSLRLDPVVSNPL